MTWNEKEFDEEIRDFALENHGQAWWVLEKKLKQFISKQVEEAVNKERKRVVETLEQLYGFNYQEDLNNINNQ